MKTRVSVKYFVNDCFLKPVFVSNLLIPNPFKLNFFDNVGNSKAFHTVLT